MQFWRPTAAKVIDDQQRHGGQCFFPRYLGNYLRASTPPGRTSDEHPCTTIENPVPMEDLRATIYDALGIPPTQSFVVEKRPVYVTKDGKGKPITELFG